MVPMRWTLLLESAALLVASVAFVGLTSLTRGRQQRYRPVLMVAVSVAGVLLLLSVLLQEGGG
jgi:hypothetical protein